MHHANFRSLPLILALGFVSCPVFAESLSAGQVLHQFNLVVIDNATSSSEVDGRSFIGGNLSGGIYDAHPDATPASNYAGLTVQGNATRVMVNGNGAVVGGNLNNSTINSGSSAVFGNASNDNFNGPAYVKGTTGGSNFNGGTNASLSTGTAAKASSSTNFGSVLTDLSTQLSHLASTGSTVTFNSSGSKATFNAIANASGMAVFDLAGIDTKVFGANEFEFNLNGAKTLILNSDEQSATIAANFLGGGAQAIGAKTLWNFYNATNLKIKNQFGGSVLAPLAAFSNDNNMEGGVFVKSLVQKGEIHLQPFNGQIPPVVTPVPEPETYVLMLVGLGFLGFVSRRRSRSFFA
jgi:choice-of-anchor A domain-containing protein